MRSRLQAVGEENAPLIGDPPETPPASRIEDSAGYDLLWLSLKALTKRTLIALADLFDLALLGSAFALALLIITNPTTNQLIEVAGYAVFVLIALYTRHR